MWTSPCLHARPMMECAEIQERYVDIPMSTCYAPDGVRGNAGGIRGSPGILHTFGGYSRHFYSPPPCINLFMDWVHS